MRTIRGIILALFVLICNGWPSFLLASIGGTGAQTKLTALDTSSPVFKYSVYCDGSIGILEKAIVSDMPNDSSRTKLKSLVLISDSSRNYSFQVYNLVPGKSIDCYFYLQVDDPEVDGFALVVCTDMAGNQSVLRAEYHTVNLAITPHLKNLRFRDSVSVDSTVLFVKNLGTGDCSLERLELKNGGAGCFTLSKIKLPHLLRPSDSVKFTVYYSARGIHDVGQGQYVRDSIGAGSECVFRYLSHIDMKSIHDLHCSDVELGDVLVGQQGVQSAQAWNESGVPIQIDSVTTNLDTSVFTFSPNPLSLRTLGAFERFSFLVKFNPSKAGSFNGKVVFHTYTDTGDTAIGVRARSSAPNPVDESEANSSALTIRSARVDNGLLSFELLTPVGDRIHWQLVDIIGRVVTSGSEQIATSNVLPLTVPMNSPASGVYCLVVTTTNSTTHRFIHVQHD